MSMKMDIQTVSGLIFLKLKVSDNMLEIYQFVMWNMQACFGPVIKVIKVEGSREHRLVIGYKTGDTKKFSRTSTTSTRCTTLRGNISVRARWGVIAQIAPC